MNSPFRNSAKVRPKSPDAVIDVVSISHTYDRSRKNEKPALKQFSYSFLPRQIYCIVGNSGSGKSTLIQHFNGLLKSASGYIYVDDFLIDSRKRKIRHIKELRRKISLVFQFPEYQLFKETVEKDIMFGPKALKVGKTKGTSRSDYDISLKMQASKYLHYLGMSEEHLQRSPFALSGGQKRRVAIAGILAIQTDIVIFDEPTAGLDPAGEAEMMKIMRDLKNDGKTVIIVTHNMDHVLEIADRVLVLDDGKMIREGKPFEIFTDEQIINETALVKPMIINFIEELRLKIPALAKIVMAEAPRTTEQLASVIKENL